MKTKIIILAVVVGLLDSCASHCGNKSYRTKRFVQIETTVDATQAQV